MWEMTLHFMYHTTVYLTLDYWCIASQHTGYIISGNHTNRTSLITSLCTYHITYHSTLITPHYMTYHTIHIVTKQNAPNGMKSPRKINHSVYDTVSHLHNYFYHTVRYHRSDHSIHHITFHITSHITTHHISSHSRTLHIPHHTTLHHLSLPHPR